MNVREGEKNQAGVMGAERLMSGLDQVFESSRSAARTFFGGGPTCLLSVIPAIKSCPTYISRIDGSAKIGTIIEC